MRIVRKRLPHLEDSWVRALINTDQLYRGEVYKVKQQFICDNVPYTELYGLRDPVKSANLCIMFIVPFDIKF
jgi:hypothetical protein